MTEDEFTAAKLRVAEDFIYLYAAYCKSYPKQLVLSAMAGAIASLAIAHGFTQENVLAAISHCFRDIGEPTEDPAAPNSRAH